MAMYNASLVGGSSVEIDGESYDGDLKLKKVISHKKLPSPSLTTCTIYVYNNKLRALSTEGHYELNNSEWTRLGEGVNCYDVVTLSGYVYAVSFTVIYGLNNDSYTWTSRYDSPTRYFRKGNTCVYDSTIYLGHVSGYGSSTQRVYKYTGGTTLTELCTVSYYDQIGKMVIKEGVLYALGTTHGVYKYNTSSSSWTQVSNGFARTCGLAILYEGSIHVFGGGSYSDGYSFRHELLSDTTSSQIGILPIMMDSGYGSAAIYKSKIVVAGGGGVPSNNSTNYSSEIYILDDEVYEIEQ